MSPNHCELGAVIAEAKSLRYTPAGLPALDLLLEHASSLLEAGEKREVKTMVKAVVFGAMAERLQKQPLGSLWCFTGFLGTARNAKGVVLHIQSFAAVPADPSS